MDPWEDDGAADSSLQREWESRREEFHTSGYREGLEDGKQQAVQEGFNQGYALGSSSGYEWGVVRGAAAMALASADRGGTAGVELDKAARQACAAVLAVPLRGVAESVCYEALLENAATDGTGEAPGGSAPLQLLPTGPGPRPPPLAQQRQPLEQALTKLRHAGFDLECQRGHALQR